MSDVERLEAQLLSYVDAARHGFAPGSNFGDTMHFDFIEGYSDAVAGGRHGDNMKKTRWSPEGDFIPLAKPEKKPKKAK